MFRITNGKGFHITFENGNTVSVQWGNSNYCQNRHPSLDPNDPWGAIKAAEGCEDAEVAAWDSNNNWLVPSGDLADRMMWPGDDVCGWVDATTVAVFIAWVATGAENARCRLFPTPSVDEEDEDYE